MNKIQRILNFAMRMEKDAQDFYSYYMDKVQSPATQKLFRELAEIERNHYEILKKKFDDYSFKEPPITISWVVDDNFAAKDPHILADNSDLVGDAEGETSDLTVIRMAYLIENDFAEFYKNAIPTVEEEDVKKFLTTLSEWETRHKEMFYARYQDLLKKYWSDIASIVFTE